MNVRSVNGVGTKLPLRWDIRIIAGLRLTIGDTLNHLGLFAKYWQPGTVKTRLGVKIGPLAACEIYQQFLFHLLVRLQATGDSRHIVFSPLDAESKFRKSTPPNWTLCAQQSGDLGARMAGFFREQFSRMNTKPDSNLSGTSEQANKIVIIGADCPLIDANLVSAAFDQLDKCPVVIGPSFDGGYYLLGMRQNCRDIFADIQWSTSSVLPATIEHLERQRIKYHLLKKMNDIDEIDDLKKLRSDMKGSEKQLDSLDRNLLDQIEAVLINSNNNQANYDKACPSEPKPGRNTPEST